MARKTTTTPVRIYTFGARLDDEAMALAQEQIRHANRYYNDLVEVENARLEAFRAARAEAAPWLAEHQPEIIALEEELEGIAESIKRDRQRTRTRQDNDALRARAAEIKAELKPLRAEAKKLRKLANGDPAVKAEGERIEALAKSMRNSLNRGSPVYWTTAGRYSNAAKDAAKRSLFRVKFKRFDGTGTVGGQTGTKGHPTTDTVFAGSHRYFQLDPLPADQWDTRRGRRSAITSGRIRIGSQGRAPVWLPFTVKIHRRLPKGLIKNAWLKISRCGDRTKVELQMTIESEVFELPAPTLPQVAVSLGFRRLPDGSSLVATAIDLDANITRLALPQGLHRSLDFHAEMQSVADLYFDEARAELKAAIEAGVTPKWVADECATIAHWRSFKRLRRVARRLGDPSVWPTWKADRLSGGLDLYAGLDEVAEWMPTDDESAHVAAYLYIWMRKDRHLRQMGADVRRKAEARRKDMFRTFVHSLKGRRIFLDKLDLSQFTSANSVLDDVAPRALARFRAQCAPAELGDLLKMAGAVEVKSATIGADGNGAGLAAIDRAAAHCVAILRSTGEDVSCVESTLEQQLQTLNQARQMAAE